MFLKRYWLLSAAVTAFVIASFAATASAMTIVVAQDTAQCPPTTTTTICYGNLSDAIIKAMEGDSLEIKPGTYSGNFLINKNIASISGSETARTFLSASGSGAALTISGVTASIKIRNLTFISAQTGIVVQSTPTAVIKSNIFETGTTSTAIQFLTSTSSEISNNTFHQNANDILSDTATVTIKNNIFSSQSTIAIGSNVSVANILNNLFFNCPATGPVIQFVTTATDYKGNIQNQDPKFVTVSASDLALRDLHLLTGSPCIDAGNSSDTDVIDSSRADMGAYGGPEADTIPFRIQGVAVSSQLTSTISVTWNANNAYTVRGYRVYYGKTPGVYDGTEATEGASPITLSTGTTVTSATLSGLTVTAAPEAPQLLSTSPRDGGLALNWTAVTGATSYIVHYGLATTGTYSINVGNVTSYTITGLANGPTNTYDVAVSAIAQATYYVAVTAFDSAGSSSGSPGASRESAYSAEAVISTGDAKESPLSNVLSDFPERLVAYPDLPNKGHGCFIATAAYGYYSDPNVQALRQFRDRYLLTNESGRAFVHWYYTHGPAAAAWLDDHPEFKPMVRAALLPAIGISFFLIKTPVTLKLGLALMVFCVLAYVFYLKRFSHRGGAC